jgi:heme-degrading monooxygenase HmoA
VIAILWTYRVEPSWAVLFEAIYGPEGDWAQLFRQADGYRGTELLRESEGRYVTIDRWDSASDFQQFKASFADAYVLLDTRCEALTEAEEFIGEFEVYETAGG